LSLQLIHLMSKMTDALRFTPLYVIQIFIDIPYYSHKNIINSEALLESDPTIEENLRQDLKEIDEIANSGDFEQIIKFVTTAGSTISKPNVLCRRYNKMYTVLFYYVGNNKHIYDLDTFMKHVRMPHIINHEVVKDLRPVKIDILCGEYYFESIFVFIFSYILYVKTKRLNLFEHTQINFTLIPTIYCSREMEHTFIFSY